MLQRLDPPPQSHPSWNSNFQSVSPHLPMGLVPGPRESVPPHHLLEPVLMLQRLDPPHQSHPSWNLNFQSVFMHHLPKESVPGHQGSVPPHHFPEPVLMPQRSVPPPQSHPSRSFQWLVPTPQVGMSPLHGLQSNSCKELQCLVLPREPIPQQTFPRLFCLSEHLGKADKTGSTGNNDKIGCKGKTRQEKRRDLWFLGDVCSSLCN